jgi:RNA polymerase sigma-70 factor (ECF subfamily)
VSLDTNVEQTTLSSIQQNALVQRAQQGDAAAFEGLYRAYAGRVYAICVRLSADRTWAEDLTQDVFVRVWERLLSFRGESDFSTWLYRITVNMVFAALRTHQRNRARMLTADSLEPYDVEDRQSATGVNPDLERAVMALPPQARQVFVLHDIEGYPHQEIGLLMDIAPGTSKAQLHRARRLLREALAR